MGRLLNAVTFNERYELKWHYCLCFMDGSVVCLVYQMLVLWIEHQTDSSYCVYKVMEMERPMCGKVEKWNSEPTSPQRSINVISVLCAHEFQIKCEFLISWTKAFSLKQNYFRTKLETKSHPRAYNKFRGVTFFVFFSSLFAPSPPFCMLHHLNNYLIRSF